MPFKQCVSIIRQESKQEGAKELTFFRFEKPPEEECTWQTKSPVYSTYSREVLSALRDRGDLDINTARAFSKLVRDAMCLLLENWTVLALRPSFAIISCVTLSIV